MPLNLRERFIKGVGWSAVDRWGNRFFSFTFIVILARLLEPAAFGVLAAAVIFTDYLDLFVSQGIGFSIIQRREVEAGHLNTAFWLNAASGVVLGVLLYGCAPFIAGVFDQDEIGSVLRSLSPVLFLSGISIVQVAILTREFRFKELAVRNLVGQVAGGAAGVILAYKGFGVWSLVAMIMARSVVGSAALWLATRWRPGFQMSMRHLKDIYGYSIKVFVDQQVIYISNRLDEGLVGYFLDTTALGFYSIGKRLVVLLIDVFNSTLGMVLFPFFTKIQTDTPRMLRAVSFGLRFYFAASIPVFMGLIVLAPAIVTFVFGKQWSEAGNVTRIIAISGPFVCAPLFIHAVFHAVGSPGVPLALNVMRGILSLILFPVGGFFGAIGIAAALTIKNIIGALLDKVAFRKRVSAEKGIFLKPVLVPVVLAIPTVIAAWILFGNLEGILSMQMSLILAVGLSGLFYAASLLRIDRSLLEDVRGLLADLKAREG